MRRPVHLMRRAGVYYFRLALPADVAGLTGRKELKRSLGTRDHRLARPRWLVASTAAHELVRRIRSMRKPTESEIRRAVREFYEVRLDSDRHSRLSLEDDYLAHQAQEAIYGKEDPPFEAIHLDAAEIASDLSCGRPGVAAIFSEQVIAEDGLAIDPSDTRSHEFRLLNHYVQRALLELIKREDERARGDFTGEAKDPFLREPLRRDPPMGQALEQRGPEGRPTGRRSTSDASSRPNGLGAKSRWTISEGFKAYLNENTSLKGKYRDDHIRTVGYFINLIGDIRLSEMTDDHLIEFKDQLMKLPRNFKATLKVDNPRDAIAKNQSLNKPTLDAVTINDKYLPNMRGYLGWAVRNKAIARNYAEDVRVMRGKSATEPAKRRSFTVAELNKLFRAPVFCGCKSPGRMFDQGQVLVRDYHFWVPLLGLFTGCRLDELGQLELRDVVQVGPYRCLWIRPTDPGDPAHPKGLRPKKVKTVNATRRLPVHEQLIRIGFNEFVEERRHRGDWRMFPEWSLGSDNTYSSTFSKWYARLLESLGIEAKEVVFHSFRHNFKAVALESGIEAEHRRRLMGHGSATTNEAYGAMDSRSEEAALRAYQALRFDGLDLAHLFRT